MKRVIAIVALWFAPQRNTELETLISSARAISRAIELKHKGQ
jgi:hypothetical protein